MTSIEKIADYLRQLLKEKEIIARCELLNRIYGFVRDAKLSGSEREELQMVVGKQIAAGIFASMMSGAPIFFDLPKLDTYTQINGRIFHFLHTQKYSRQDFDSAQRKFLVSLPELKSLLRRNLADLLKEFMEDAGYQPIGVDQDGFRFEAGERRVNAFVFTSVKALDLSRCRNEEGADCVILVPSSESLEPFVQFFREKGTFAAEAKIQIWIANMEQGSIDPFIGYTTDLDIYRQFKNPRLAEMVRTNWATGTSNQQV